MTKKSESGQKPAMIITGSSKGIGRGLAEFFLTKGFRVAGCSRNQANLTHPDYHHSQVDVSDENQVVEWARLLKRRFRPIDVLICNAGFAPAALLMSMTSGEILEKTLRTNTMGTYYVCREISEIMMLQKYGRIITLSSMAAGLHETGTSAYSASKNAIVEMTKILAKEMAPLGITCNVLAPSMMMTEAVEALGKTVIDRALEKLTIKRTLRIEEICHVVSFLAAPESGCITGQVIQMGLVT